MRYLTLLILFASCGENHLQKKNPASSYHVPVRQETVSHYNFWTANKDIPGVVRKDTIQGKPVRFYLDNPHMVSVGKAFYEGRFMPLDDDSTFALLDSATTNDAVLRPFYVYCFDIILKISDGALSEGMCSYAMNYVRKYPKEFFELADKKEINYFDWAGRIAFDAVWDYQSCVKDIDNMSDEDRKLISNEISRDIKRNCKNCSPYILNRIDSFSALVVGNCGICE